MKKITSTLISFGLIAIFLISNCSENKKIILVAPAIQKINLQGVPAKPGNSITATVIAKGGANLPLSYSWTATNGWIITNGVNSSVVTITAPNNYQSSGEAMVKISDKDGAYATGTVSLRTECDDAPVINNITASPNPTAPGSTIIVTVNVSNNSSCGKGNGEDALVYTWKATSGWIVTGYGATATVIAPHTYNTSGSISVTIVKEDEDDENSLALIAVSTYNAPPVINSFTALPNPAMPGTIITATVAASDPDGDTLSYAWSATSGWAISGYGTTATVMAPDSYNAAGAVTASVSDSYGATASAMVVVSTTNTNSVSPVLIGFTVSPNPVPTGSSALATAYAYESNRNTLSYTWSATPGWIVTGYGATATVVSPCQYPSTGAISVTVSDNYGDTASNSVSVSTSLVTHVYQVGNVPNGIAVDASGNIWVTNSHDNTVSKLDSSGSIVGTYPVSGSIPADIAIDGSGNLWIANLYSANVTKMSSSGSIIATYPAGTYPAGISIDASGNVWIANSWSNYITRLNSSGSILGTFYPGKYPAGMAVDASGNLWIANYQGNSVTELSPSGSIIATVAISDSPSGIAIDSSGNIWVPNNTSVIKLSPSGSIQGTFPVGAGLHTVAIDSSDNLWITNVNDNSLTELSPDGEIMNKYQVGTQPYAPIIDAKGNVWTVNYGGNNITELVCVAKGPQYFPFSGPQFPGGQNY